MSENWTRAETWFGKMAEQHRISEVGTRDGPRATASFDEMMAKANKWLAHEAFIKAAKPLLEAIGKRLVGLDDNPDKPLVPEIQRALALLPAEEEAAMETPLDPALMERALREVRRVTHMYEVPLGKPATDPAEFDKLTKTVAEDIRHLEGLKVDNLQAIGPTLIVLLRRMLTLVIANREKDK